MRTNQKKRTPENSFTARKKIAIQKMMRIHIDGKSFFMRKIRMKSKNSRRNANEYEQKEA